MAKKKKKSFMGRRVIKGIKKTGKAYKAMSKFANVWKTR